MTLEIEDITDSLANRRSDMRFRPHADYDGHEKVIYAEDNDVGFRAFIAVQGCRDVDATLQFYRDQLGTPTQEGGQTRVQIINERFGLSTDHLTRLGIVKLPQDFLIEVDAYPAAAVARVQATGWLPPGISMVSFEDDSITVPALLQGPDGEWIERLPVTPP